jgi:SAM-dependent methyltransferase
MRRFWDERAAENALYFVDSRLDYGRPDEERFWAQGARDLDRMLGPLGVEIGAEDSVLELGCGVGRQTRAIAARAREVRAVDVSERMLALAREHNADLGNVEWILGDGVSLRGVPDSCVDVCVSAVVFQHIPDPAVTLGYVREMGRVLRPGGWAAFHVSQDPAVHRPRRGPRAVRLRAQALLGRAPRGQSSPEWLGSPVDLDDLRAAASEGGLHIERVLGEGTQWCVVLARLPPLSTSG